MVNLNPAKMIVSESNVDIPKGEAWSSAYDLALYEELGNPLAYVLAVKVDLSIDFRDGSDITWSDADKDKFKSGIKTECENAWSEKFKLKAQWCSDDLPSIASVVISVNPEAGSWSSHWSITARKVNSPGQNFVRSKGDVRFESTGLDEKIPQGGTEMRRAIVHEFGHFLGYRDEYPNSDRGTNAYLSDVQSMMHSGKIIRQRHYVFFADWMTKQAKKGKIDGTWAVDGVRTLDNTQV